MNLKLAIVGGACVLAGLAPASALARHSHKKPAPSYYVALGDSLAVGMQPNAAGATVATNHGYTNFVYAAERKKVKGLRYEDLGCGGESTGTMLHGGLCKYAGGSQLAAAVKFIRTHRIAFITLDIGANDVDGCAKAGGIDSTCLNNGIAAIAADTPKIVGALRKAAGAKTKIAAMTYYDPFLADYLSTSPATMALAAGSVPLDKNVNAGLITAYNAKHVKVADVATAFGTYVDFTKTATLAGHGTVPVAVAKICTLTWMCAAAPRGPNIHATTAGYHVIADTFLKVLGVKS